MAATIHATVVRRDFRVRFDKVLRVSTYQAGEGGVADHGLLLGLEGDDHPQYHTDDRGDARYYRRAEVDAALDGRAEAAHGHAELHTHVNRATLDAIPNHGVAAAGQVLTCSAQGLAWSAAAQGDGSGDMLKAVYDEDGDGVVDAAASVPWGGVSGKPASYPPAAHDHAGVYDPAGAAASEAAAQRAAHEAAFDHAQIGSGGGGAADHGALTGLTEDDHPQYHTDARGDARYAPLGHHHDGDYEPADGTILRQSDLAGSGAANAPARSDHDHVGIYEPADSSILKEGDLAGSGTAVTPARSDHDHAGVYDHAGAAASEAVAQRAAHEAAFDHAGYDAHLADTDNPHAVTAGQTGADPAGTAAAEVAAHQASPLHLPDAAGASTGDVLTRQSDGSADWQTPAVGGGAGFTTGLARRPRYEYAGDSQIRLSGGGAYDVGGVLAAWTGDILFTVGGGGSNAGSSDLAVGGSEWQYLYLTAGTAAPSAADFFNSPASPAWNDENLGWYDPSGNRCVFAFYNNGGGVVYPFEMADELMVYGEFIPTNVAGTDVDTDWIDVAFDVPAVSSRVLAQILAISAGDTLVTKYRPKGLPGNGLVLISLTNNTRAGLPVQVTVNSDGVLEYAHSRNDGATSTLYQVGHYLPRGM